MRAWQGSLVSEGRGGRRRRRGKKGESGSEEEGVWTVSHYPQARLADQTDLQRLLTDI